MGWSTLYNGGTWLRVCLFPSIDPCGGVSVSSEKHHHHRADWKNPKKENREKDSRWMPAWATEGNEPKKVNNSAPLTVHYVKSFIQDVEDLSSRGLDY